MSLFLRIILLVASVLFAIYVIKKIRKSQMKIGDSIYWISLIVLIVTLSIFPNIIISLAKWIGIESPANLLYLLMIFIAIGKIFFLSVQNSQLEYKICILRYGRISQKIYRIPKRRLQRMKGNTYSEIHFMWSLCCFFSIGINAYQSRWQSGNK